MNELPLNLYAFWRYHDGVMTTYLHGQVVRMYSGGQVEVKNYPGFLITPVKLLPLDAGKELGLLVTQTTAETRVKLTEVKEAGEARLVELLGLS